MTPLFKKFLGMNWLLVANMFALLVFGVFAIYSATYMRESVELAGLWKKQVLWIGVGTVAFFVISLMDYRWVFWGGIPLYLIGLTLSILAVAQGDDETNTAAYLNFAGVNVQPSQIAMAGGIIVTALVLGYLHRIHPFFRNHFVRLGVAGLACGIPFLIVLKQGDFGSAIVWLPVCAAMMLVGNIPFRYLITIGLLGLMVTPWAYYFGLKTYQKERIQVYIDMLSGKEVDTQGSAYAASYIIKAVGSGRFDGKGYLAEKSINALGFIPKNTSFTDFIFAVVAEEQGFFGTSLMLGGFLLLMVQALFIAFFSRDSVGRLLVVGVVALFFAHVFQHVGMNLLLMPITGIPLPFVSYGGTFVGICMFLCGLVQSVWVHRAVVAKKREASDSSFESAASFA